MDIESNRTCIVILGIPSGTVSQVCHQVPHNILIEVSGGIFLQVSSLEREGELLWYIVAKAGMVENQEEQLPCPLGLSRKRENLTYAIT